MAQQTQAIEHNVYGSRFALCASIGKNRDETSWVLNLVLSKKLPDSSRYDWDNGIKIQVTSRELSDFMATMTGGLKSLRIERANSVPKKQLDLKPDPNDRNVVLLSVRTADKGTAMMVRVGQADRLKLAAFSFKALMRNNGGVGQDVLYMMHRDIYKDESIQTQTTEPVSTL